MKNILKIKNSVIVDMGDKFNKDIVYYFTEGRNKNIQMTVMCHKPAQIENMARVNCDPIFVTPYNGADLFKNFYTIYECKHDFHGIIRELNKRYFNCTDGTDDALSYGMIRYNKKEETFIIFDRKITIIFDSRVGFIDLKALKELDLKEIVKAVDSKTFSTIGGIITSIFYDNFIKSNPTVRTAAHVAAHASHMINSTGALFNYAYGTESMPCNGEARLHIKSVLKLVITIKKKTILIMRLKLYTKRVEMI